MFQHSDSWQRTTTGRAGARLLLDVCHSVDQIDIHGKNADLSSQGRTRRLARGRHALGPQRRRSRPRRNPKGRSQARCGRSRGALGPPTQAFFPRSRQRSRQSLYVPGIVKLLPCDLRDLEESWAYFRRNDMHKLSAVDATSFAIMKRAGIRVACTFDRHFAVAGFRLVA